MTFRDHDEILKGYISALGEDFGRSYVHAFDEWCDLWVTWKQFRNLFCSGPERVELLNQAGAEFFYRVDRVFFEAVLLALCRLTDPAATGKRKNLSVMLFQQFMDTQARKDHMAETLAAADASTHFARDWRNRRVGHNDYGLKIGRAEPLEKATIGLADIAIQSIFEVFSYISREYMSVTIHNEVIDGLNNEMVMLDRLYRGVRNFADDLERIRVLPYREEPLPDWLHNR